MTKNSNARINNVTVTTSDDTHDRFQVFAGTELVYDLQIAKNETTDFIADLTRKGVTVTDAR